MVFKLYYYNICCIVDSVCNSAGLGFNGYNKLGYAQWDLVSGMDIWAFEVRNLRSTSALLYNSLHGC